MVQRTEGHAEAAGALFLQKKTKTTKRSRAGFACITCRRRKVRCDVQVQRDTCTNCALNKAACQVDLSREGGNKEFAPMDTEESATVMSPLPSLEEGPVHIWDDDDCSIAGTPGLESDAGPGRHGSKLDKNDTVPSRELRCHLVHCYLRHVYPSLPIMTVCQLVNIINLQDGESPLCGWFVLNGFFATSIIFLDENVLQRFGRYSRRYAIERFISKAKVNREALSSKYQCRLT